MYRKMIFSEHGVTPQVPSVAAVRIVLARVTGDRSFVDGIGAEDVREFDFCLANSIVFVINAMECAKEVLGVASLGQPQQEVFDTLISEMLKEMSLARIPVDSDGRFAARVGLRQELNQLTLWDRHKATEMLARAIEAANQPALAGFHLDGSM